MIDNNHGLVFKTNHHNYNQDPKEQDEHMELPPGFRFHPTDEELITHYLSRKVADPSFEPRAIGEVDLNKCEPWDLPRKAKMGEKEWYFFCVRDRKYPTGLRTNRATEAGYWKATGKDKEIHRAGSLVGMKKTLVFYRGRAPKGEKSNWVMHEYRLEGSLAYYNLPKPSKNEWVLCRVFHKSGGAKKAPLLGGLGMVCLPREPVSSAAAAYASGMQLSPLLPPLMDSTSTFNAGASSTGAGAAAHVTCFSNSMEGYFHAPLLFPPTNNMPGESAGGSKGERRSEMQVSVSQDTGVTTTDANVEISSVFSHQNMIAKQQQRFDGGAAAGAGGSLSLEDCLWEY